MKKRLDDKKVFLSICLIFLLLGAVIGIEKEEKEGWYAELSLDEYDRTIYDGQDACFDYFFKSNIWDPTIEKLEIEVNGKRFLRKDVRIDNITGFLIKEKICIPAYELDSNDSLVKLSFYYRSIFFHVTKKNESAAYSDAPSYIKILSCPSEARAFDNANITFEVFNGRSKGIVDFVHIYIDGKKVRSVRVDLDAHEKKISSEEIEVPREGAVNVSFSFDDSYDEVSIERTGDCSGCWNIPPSIGITIDTIIAVALVFILPGIGIGKRYGNDFISFVSLTLGSGIAIATLSSFVLSALNAFSAPSLFAVLTIVSIASVFLTRKTRVPAFDGDMRLFNLLFVAYLSLTTAVTLSFYNPFTEWTVYYERYAESVYKSGSIPATDQLSYLGKPATYVPGYFLFKTSFAYLSNLYIGDLLANMLIQIMLNILFFFAVFFFVSRLKFGIKEGMMAFFILFSASFTVPWFTMSYSHLAGYSLLLIALGIAVEKPRTGALIGATSGFFHIPFAIAFVLLYIFITKKINKREVIEVAVIGLSLIAGYQGYLILDYGDPHEIEEANWGYLISGGLEDIQYGIAGWNIYPLLISLLLALYYGAKGEKYFLRLGIISLAIILVMFLVTFRVNIYLGILLVVLFVNMVNRVNADKNVVLFVLFILTFFSVVSPVIYGYTFGSLPYGIDAPFAYINTHTSSGSKLLIEPYYGHLATYLAKRPVLADLCVEYADPVKYNDTMTFIEKHNESILDKYGIDYTVTLERMRIISMRKRVLEEKEITFDYLDKVYDNGALKVHWNR